MAGARGASRQLRVAPPGSDRWPQREAARSPPPKACTCAKRRQVTTRGSPKHAHAGRKTRRVGTTPRGDLSHARLQREWVPRPALSPGPARQAASATSDALTAPPPPLPGGFLLLPPRLETESCPQATFLHFGDLIRSCNFKFH